MAKKTAIGIDLGTTYSSLARLSGSLRVLPTSAPVCKGVSGQLDLCIFIDCFYMFLHLFHVFTWFYWDQVASVCGRTTEWRSLPTTRATEPLHLMWLLQTPSDLLVMPPRIRWHAILRTLPLVWQHLADHSWQLQCKRRLGTLQDCGWSWWAMIHCTCHDQKLGNVGQWYVRKRSCLHFLKNSLLFWQLLDCLQKQVERFIVNLSCFGSESCVQAIPRSLMQSAWLAASLRTPSCRLTSSCGLSSA